MLKSISKTEKINRTILIVAMLFMLYTTMNQWNALKTMGWVFRHDLLLISTIGIVILLFLAGYGWHLILRILNQPLPYKASLVIWSFSLLYRYIPGGLWGYASRISLSKIQGVTTTHSGLSVYLETLLIAISSATIGFIAVLKAIDIPVRLEAMLLIWIGMGLLLHPKVILILGSVFPNRIKLLIADVQLPGSKALLGFFFYYLFYWILCDSFFLFFVLSIYPVPFEHWLLIGTGFTLCYFAGLIAFFAPSGIGIRESALYILFLNVLPNEVNLLVSVGSRLWLTVGEVIYYMLVFLIIKILKQKPIVY